MKRESGGRPRRGNTRQAVSLAAAIVSASAAGHVPRRRLEALGADELGKKVAKDDALVVGDEVDLSVAAALGARGAARGPRFRRGPCRSAGGRRRSRRSGPRAPSTRSRAGASCPPRPRRTGVARSRARCPTRRARPPRRGPCSGSRAPSNRSACGVVSSTSTRGSPAMRTASVETCTTRRTPAAAHPRTTLRVPSTFTRSNSSQGPESSTLAAEWKATSHPAAPASIEARSVTSPRTGSAPRAATASAAASERASARTSSPVARRLCDQPAADEPRAAGDEAALMPRLLEWSSERSNARLTARAEWERAG